MGSRMSDLPARFHDLVMPGEAVASTIVIVLVAFIGSLYINRALTRMLRRIQPRLRLPSETTVLFTRALSSLLWLCAGLLVLDVWGISVVGIWTVMASVAAVIGVGFLAVWTMVSNITASLFITIWHPFRLSDTVELLPENLRGRVIDRNLMFTALREESGATLQIPNNLFFQKMFRVFASDEQYLFEFLEAGARSRAASPPPAAPDAAPAAALQASPAEKMPQS
jgi:small-conductance mechanosensitive channel